MIRFNTLQIHVQCLKLDLITFRNITHYVVRLVNSFLLHFQDFRIAQKKAVLWFKRSLY